MWDSRGSQGPSKFLLYDPGGWAGWGGQVLPRQSPGLAAAFKIPCHWIPQTLPGGAGAELWADVQPFCLIEKCTRDLTAVLGVQCDG